MLQRKSMKSLLQKLIDTLLENCYITREEINDFLTAKNLNNLPASSAIDSFDSTMLRYNSTKMMRIKSSMKKMLKMDNTFLSSYSNCTSSIEELRQDFTHKLYKINEDNDLLEGKNSESLNYETNLSPFYKENHHETIG